MIIAIAIGYFIGSIPFGLLLVKASGMGDIRAIGSGNIGATNVLRAGNKKIAALTLVLDALKGVVAVMIFAHSVPSALLVGLAAIIGHCFPVWLKFKGGKGVATALGVLLAATPLAGLVAITTWGIVAGFFRYSSLAALSAIAITPLAVLLIYGTMPAALTLSIAVLVFIRHKTNIQRLMAGEEPKIGSKKKEKSDEPAKSAE